MQTTAHSKSRSGLNPSNGKANTYQWSWTGQLHGVKGEDVEYHAIINMGSDEGIQISLCDGTSSYARQLSRDELATLCESSAVAYVEPHQRISRIQAALKCDEKDITRVIRNGEDLELRVSAPWGSEFGDLSIKLDIAAISLDRTSGNGYFLSSAFERIARSRAGSQELRNKRKELELEVEELWEAKKRLDVIMQGRSERMQVFADALNEYKRRMTLESTK